MAARRPLDMFHIGNHYFPEGMPDGTSLSEVTQRYVDSDGQPFCICYTRRQMQKNIQKNPVHGFFPYVPFFATRA